MTYYIPGHVIQSLDKCHLELLQVDNNILILPYQQLWSQVTHKTWIRAFQVLYQKHITVNVKSF